MTQRNGIERPPGGWTGEHGHVIHDDPHIAALEHALEATIAEVTRDLALRGQDREEVLVAELRELNVEVLADRLRLAEDGLRAELAAPPGPRTLDRCAALRATAGRLRRELATAREVAGRARAELELKRRADTPPSSAR